MIEINENNLRLAVSYEPWGQTFEFRMAEQKPFGLYAAQPLQFSDAKKGDIIRPYMTIGSESAQKMMDELWRCGLRPTEGSGSAGSLAATQKHLEDMRTLVFGKKE